VQRRDVLRRQPADAVDDDAGSLAVRGRGDGDLRRRRAAGQQVQDVCVGVVAERRAVA
jgi:hypothetical protein